MKKEIVVKVQMRCDKCRTKSMELAASAEGVSSVSLTGEDRNQLVVVGDGVDAVSLATVLRKKVGPTDIIRVGEPNKNTGDKKSGKGEEKGDEKKDQKSKDSDSGKEKEKGEKKDEKKNDKKDDDQQQYQYQQQQMPKIEYLQQWYPGYPSYPQPQVIVYDSPNYPNPNCSIM